MRRVARVLLAAGLALTAVSPALLAQHARLTEHDLAAFRFRSIGPAVTGGRIHDVEALPNDPSTIYLGTASGGIWKTTNKGTTWTPVFDRYPVSTFGDIAVAPSNPSILYAGTGEQNNRQSTSWGNGVYRSDDAGETWTHVGLADTRHIGKIVVDPRDPEVVYVAALGNLWKPSEERGVYRSTDAGRHWTRVLAVDSLTGAVDLVINPAQPAVLYAAMYQRLRRTWGFNGGGPGSGIYRSRDGGTTWQELTRGIPAGDKGRIGLAIARTDPRVLVATIEHADRSGTYRTEDGGDTWARVNALNPRPMYYSHIFIDPTNADRVYVLATSMYKSEDGGRTFDRVPTNPTYDVGVHADYHHMWIDPGDPEHYYLVGDAGLHETWDMGATFIRINNIPIGQFYAIGVDMRDPYYIYGGMQDNHSWMGPSATRRWIGIINDDWSQIGFGDGMYWQPDPTSHRYVYGNAQNGSYTRLDAETGDLLDIRPRPPEGETYRWDWVSPSLVSRHDPATVYVGGNRLFISHDRGDSWARTVDLTRQIDRDTLELMGVRGADITISRNDGTSSYGEITTIAESPRDPRILWVGTDDGNVQVSRDGGGSWTEVSGNVPDVPAGTYVSRVAGSRAGDGVAWVTFDAHRDGDFRPFVYHTADFGRTWTSRIDGLPAEGSVNVIVEHPDNPELMFLGTEHALFVSLDAGGRWMRFASNLPTTHYDDMLVHPREKDLVIGTHGRSIWILDDTRPLAEWTAVVAGAPGHMFSVRPATVRQYWKTTSYRGQAAYAGENPPDGAVLTYAVGPGARSARLLIQADSGTTIREIEAEPGPGLQRSVWDLRHRTPPHGPVRREPGLPELPHPLGPRGPFVSPGYYTAVLEVDGRSVSRQTVEVRGDPDVPLTLAQWREREAVLVGLLELEEAVWEAEQRALGSVGRPRSCSGRSQHELTRLRCDVYALAETLNGEDVRQGSLYPPTQTHRERIRELEHRWAALRGT
ncbi:MAG TPA: hypothetical protein VGA22_04835 [Gemmatimonadales bacterium]|jgi:photosystem II stability/assembly factor-like uncharacterized protein